MSDPPAQTLASWKRYLHIEACTCPLAWKSLGRLDRVNMGKGWVRMSTTKDCPEHDACKHWPKGSPNWCPIHSARGCPR